MSDDTPRRGKRWVTRQVPDTYEHADEEQVEDEEEADEEQAPTKRKAPAWFVIGAVVLVLGCCGFFYFKSTSDEGKPDDLGAQTVCQTFVERRLKAPSTAKFSHAKVTNDGTTWTVSGSVDAENSFGAMLRHNYVCTVRPAAGENWSLQSLTGLD